MSDHTISPLSPFDLFQTLQDLFKPLFQGIAHLLQLLGVFLLNGLKPLVIGMSQDS